MWLFNSSIGRKVVMSVTGIALILFLTFHMSMNVVALFSGDAYNMICEFLGANWYALVATAGLAGLAVVHIVYAFLLTAQNRRARGGARYEVTARPGKVEWASQNMLVLGIVILAFLVVHMIQFWAKMQLAEILHCDYMHEGVAVPPAAGSLFIQIAFSQVYTPIVYIAGFIALWFHMNHGMWSMFQSAGWDNDTWLPRLKKIGCWWTTIVVALFLAEAVVFTVRAHSNSFEQELKEYVESKASTHALQMDALVPGMPGCEAAQGTCGGDVCPDAQPENL